MSQMAQFDRTNDSQVEIIILRSTAMIWRETTLSWALEDGFKGHGYKVYAQRVTNLWGRGRKKAGPLQNWKEPNLKLVMTTNKIQWVWMFGIRGSYNSVMMKLSADNSDSHTETQFEH